MIDYHFYNKQPIKNNQLNEKTPLDYTVFQYILIIILGAIGGLVARLQILICTGIHCWKCALGRLAVDSITSGFCGLLAFWACESINMKPLLTAVMIGITGHMGSRAIFLIEKLIISKCKKIADEEN